MRSTSLFTLTVVAASAFALFTRPALAAAPRGTHAQPHARSGGVSAGLNALNLTASQKAAANKLAMAAQKQAIAIRDNPSLTMQQKRVKFGAVQMSTDRAFQKILTPSQRVKYAAFKRQQIQQALQRMTPQQRAMVEQMMKQQMGQSGR